MKTLKPLIITIFAALALTACNSDKRNAENLLEEIRTEYAAGNYQKVIHYIDSLRETYPKAVEQRRAALAIYKDASLHIAQDNLANVDHDLQQMESKLDSLTAIVTLHRQSGTATAEELQNLNELRAKHDSLKAQFDVECAKIRYIHKKQKE